MYFPHGVPRKVTPTMRQDSFRLKIIFIGFLKGGAEEDEAPGGKRGDISLFSHTLSYDYSYRVLVVRG
jgi:hypothetical protein